VTVPMAAQNASVELLSTKPIPAGANAQIVTTPSNSFCKAPFVESECVCPKSCADVKDPRFRCPKPGDDECERGCQCPPGMVKHNDDCISDTLCRTCIGDDGKQHQVGEFWEVDECVQKACIIEKDSGAPVIATIRSEEAKCNQPKPKDCQVKTEARNMTFTWAPGCISEQPATFSYCAGSCAFDTDTLSWPDSKKAPAQAKSDTPLKISLSQPCNCCQPSKKTTAIINMQCKDNTQFPIEYDIIQACGCQECSSFSSNFPGLRS
jgi:hypothetical protein